MYIINNRGPKSLFLTQAVTLPTFPDTFTSPRNGVTIRYTLSMNLPSQTHVHPKGMVLPSGEHSAWTYLPRNMYIPQEWSYHQVYTQHEPTFSDTCTSPRNGVTIKYITQHEPTFQNTCTSPRNGVTIRYIVSMNLPSQTHVHPPGMELPSDIHSAWTYLPRHMYIPQEWSYHQVYIQHELTFQDTCTSQRMELPSGIHSAWTYLPRHMYIPQEWSYHQVYTQHEPTFSDTCTSPRNGVTIKYILSMNLPSKTHVHPPGMELPSGIHSAWINHPRHMYIPREWSYNQVYTQHELTFPDTCTYPRNGITIRSTISMNLPSQTHVHPPGMELPSGLHSAWTYLPRHMYIPQEWSYHQVYTQHELTFQDTCTYPRNGVNITYTLSMNLPSKTHVHTQGME